MPYQLLEQFRALFDGTRYRHRVSVLGDSVAQRLFEDLYSLDKSPKLSARVTSGEAVLSSRNLTQGVKARRGDGTFGETVPNSITIRDVGFAVPRGRLATVEIGVEVKVLFKAMIKQIDRVMHDLEGQIEQFRRGGGTPICVGIVGVNYAESCTSYEGRRKFPTDGKKHKHPIQEAIEAERRILARVRPKLDELLILRFRATNVQPYPFEWVDKTETELDYGALLTRICREYERRF